MLNTHVHDTWYDRLANEKLSSTILRSSSLTLFESQQHHRSFFLSFVVARSNVASVTSYIFVNIFSLNYARISYFNIFINKKRKICTKIYLKQTMYYNNIVHTKKHRKNKFHCISRVRFLYNRHTHHTLSSRII